MPSAAICTVSNIAMFEFKVVWSQPDIYAASSQAIRLMYIYQDKNDKQGRQSFSGYFKVHCFTERKDNWCAKMLTLMTDRQWRKKKYCYLHYPIDTRRKLNICTSYVRSVYVLCLRGKIFCLKFYLRLITQCGQTKFFILPSLPYLNLTFTMLSGFPILEMQKQLSGSVL